MNVIRTAGALLLILLLVGCDGFTSDSNQPAGPTATPVPGTPQPLDESALVILFNRVITDSQDPLSQTVEATYNVDGVSFLPGMDMQLSTFSVEAHCESIRHTTCCTAEHTFLVIVQAMKSKPDKFIQSVPATISQFQVTGYDHETLLGTISFPWQPIREYLIGKINGYQLGGEINKYFSIP